MLQNDQLTRRERIRLEALSQARAMPFSGATADEAFAEILRRAEEIERWLMAADTAAH